MLADSGNQHIHQGPRGPTLPGGPTWRASNAGPATLGALFLWTGELANTMADFYFDAERQESLQM